MNIQTLQQHLLQLHNKAEITDVLPNLVKIKYRNTNLISVKDNEILQYFCPICNIH